MAEALAPFTLRAAQGAGQLRTDPINELAKMVQMQGTLSRMGNNAERLEIDKENARAQAGARSALGGVAARPENGLDTAQGLNDAGKAIAKYDPVAAQKFLEMSTKMSDAQRARAKDQQGELFKAMQWADTPEKWNRAIDYFVTKGGFADAEQYRGDFANRQLYLNQAMTGEQEFSTAPTVRQMKKPDGKFYDMAWNRGEGKWQQLGTEPVDDPNLTEADREVSRLMTAYPGATYQDAVAVQSGMWKVIQGSENNIPMLVNVLTSEGRPVGLPWGSATMPGRPADPKFGDGPPRAAPPTGTPPPGGELPGTVEDVTPEPEPAPTAPDAGRARGEAKTYWDLAGDTAGMLSTGKNLAAKIAGQFGADVAGDVVTARQVMEAAPQELIKALINNSRFPVAQVDMLLKEIEIKPDMWDSPPALKRRMIGMDSYLRNRRDNEARAAKDFVNLTSKQRAEATEAVYHLDNFIRALGVPEEMRQDSLLRSPEGRAAQSKALTQEELDAVPVGRTVSERGDDGRIHTWVKTETGWEEKQ